MLRSSGRGSGTCPVRGCWRHGRLLPRASSLVASARRLRSGLDDGARSARRCVFVVEQHRKSRAERVVSVKPRPASRFAPHGRVERAIQDGPGPIRGWGDQDPESQRKAHWRSALIAITGSPHTPQLKRCAIMLLHDNLVKMKGASHGGLFRNPHAQHALMKGRRRR